MGFRVDMHVVLGRDRVVVRVPRFGVEFSDEPLVAVGAPAGRSREVAAVGAEARRPIADYAAPVARINPVVERDLEVLGALLEYFVVQVWWSLPAWVKLLGERRVHVETAGFAHDEATRDAIAAACSASPDGVTIDGAAWYGPSTHDFRLSGWRDGVLLGATLAFGAFVVASGALDALRASIEREPKLLAPVVLVAAQGVHTLWSHARQQRRRAAQRERLMASGG